MNDLSLLQKRILKHLRQHPAPMTAQEIHAAVPTNNSLKRVRHVLSQLEYRGLVARHRTRPQHRFEALPVAMKAEYQALMPSLRHAARTHGYALAFHGSGQRDLDLVAVPWVEEASPPAALVEALRAAIGGFTRVEDSTNPERKPHGRLAWSIYLNDPRGHLYIDLSVMPQTKKKPAR